VEIGSAERCVRDAVLVSKRSSTSDLLRLDVYTDHLAWMGCLGQTDRDGAWSAATIEDVRS